MAHAQKPDFVFPRNGRVHLNRWGRQFSRLLAAEVCASVWVMLYTPRSEMAWEYWLPTPFASFPFTSRPVRHRVPISSERALLDALYCLPSKWQWSFSIKILSASCRISHTLSHNNEQNVLAAKRHGPAFQAAAKFRRTLFRPLRQYGKKPHYAY